VTAAAELVLAYLPRSREHEVALRAEERPIRVRASRQRSRDADVRIDLECRFGSFRSIHRCGRY
jgi:hypothetical protein